MTVSLFAADPLVGQWAWGKNGSATFRVDGTGSNSFGSRATWSFTHNPELQRKYQLIWDGGGVTDDATLSEDQKTLQIKNSHGESFIAQRTSVPPSPTSDASTAPLTSIESIFALVPASVNLRQGSGYNPVAVKQAEDAIVTQGTGRPAALSYKVEVVEPNKAYGFSYLVKSPITPFSTRGVNLQAEIWGFFKEDQGAAVARVQKGSTVVVAGTLDHCNIVMHEGKPLLRVDLANAKLYGSMSAATAELSK